jgi:hypothetical protein
LLGIVYSLVVRLARRATVVRIVRLVRFVVIKLILVRLVSVIRIARSRVVRFTQNPPQKHMEMCAHTGLLNNFSRSHTAFGARCTRLEKSDWELSQTGLENEVGLGKKSHWKKNQAGNKSD